MRSLFASLSSGQAHAQKVCQNANSYSTALTRFGNVDLGRAQREKV